MRCSSEEEDSTIHHTVPLGLVFQACQRRNHSSEAMSPDEKGYFSTVRLLTVPSRPTAQIVKVCNQAVQTFKIHPLHSSTLSVPVGITRIHSDTIFCHCCEYMRVASHMLAQTMMKAQCSFGFACAREVFDGEERFSPTTLSSTFHVFHFQYFVCINIWYRGPIDINRGDDMGPFTRIKK